MTTCKQAIEDLCVSGIKGVQTYLVDRNEPLDPAYSAFERWGRSSYVSAHSRNLTSFLRGPPGPGKRHFLMEEVPYGKEKKNSDTYQWW